MSNYHVFECDRCLKKEDHAQVLPNFWATVKVKDTNRTSYPTEFEYEKDFCHECMNVIRNAMAVVPKKISSVA